MSITIPHPETDDPVEVFVRLIESEIKPNYIEAMCRAPTKEAWDAAAIANGLLNPDGEEVYGVNIEHIGPIVITPATYDEDGEELTPAVVDERHHVNFRIAEHLTWQPIALAWMTYGQPDSQINNEEKAKVLSNISLIDPDSINSPSRVYFQ